MVYIRMYELMKLMNKSKYIPITYSYISTKHTKKNKNTQRTDRPIKSYLIRYAE